MVELTSLFVMIIGGACVLFSLAQINDSLNRIAISLGALDKNEPAVGVPEEVVDATAGISGQRLMH